MNVSIHARAQLLGRMPANEAVPIITELEEAKAPKGKEARIIRRFGEQRSDGQSNGDILVAIIEGGTVVTVYWRRGTQTFTAEGFKVDRLTDTTRTEAEQARFDDILGRPNSDCACPVASEKAIAALRKAWGAR